MKKIIKKVMAWLAIFALVLPLNATPQKALADSNNVSQLVFTSDPQTINQNQASAQISVQTQNIGNAGENISETNHLILETTSSTGEFSSNASSWSGVTQLTMNSNTQNKNFYYKDSTGGTFTLKVVSQEHPTWTSAIQTMIVKAPKLNNVSIASNNTTPTLAKPGDTVTLNIVASESLQTVSSTINGVVANVVGGGNSWTISRLLTINDNEGVIPFSINFTDLSGNSGIAVSATTNSSTVTFDKSAPAAPTVTKPSTTTSVNSVSETITGEAETGSTVKVYTDTTNDGSIIGETVVASTVANSPYSVSVPLTQGVANNFLITATDAAGNESLPTDVSTITVDSTKPNLTVSSPIDGQLFATATPTATYSASDTNLAGVTVTIDNGVATAYTSGAALGTLANGSHQLKFTATDTAGNSTSISRNIVVNTNLSNVSTNLPLPANTSNALIDDSANSGIVLDGINTTGDVTFNIGKYNNNPGSDLSGVSAFGKYFEISASNTSKISFPLIIKIYYTQSDLNAAGITEDKLDGIYFYNSVSGKYERYADSGVNSADVMLGTKQYSGYVYANADHLTPIIAAYDIIAPSKPANFTAESGDGKVTLKWDDVSGVNKYKVRYRKSTSTDNIPYTYVDVNSDKTSLEISGLQNVVEYEFGITSLDTVSNMSDWAVVVATPIASATTSPITTAPKVVQAVAITQSAPQLPTFEDLSSKEEKETVENEPKANDDQGKIKGEQTEQAGSKSAVTVAILLLAIAAGIGGYYLYEWWIAKGALAGVSAPKEIKPVRKNPSSKRKNQKGRW